MTAKATDLSRPAPPQQMQMEQTKRTRCKFCEPDSTGHAHDIGGFYDRRRCESRYWLMKARETEDTEEARRLRERALDAGNTGD